MLPGRLDRLIAQLMSLTISTMIAAKAVISATKTSVGLPNAAAMNRSTAVTPTSTQTITYVLLMTHSLPKSGFRSSGWLVQVAPVLIDHTGPVLVAVRFVPSEHPELDIAVPGSDRD